MWRLCCEFSATISAEFLRYPPPPPVLAEAGRCTPDQVAPPRNTFHPPTPHSPLFPEAPILLLGDCSLHREQPPHSPFTALTIQQHVTIGRCFVLFFVGITFVILFWYYYLLSFIFVLLFLCQCKSCWASAQGRRGGGLGPGGGGGVCATGAGAHQGQTSREGEKDIWWTARTARGGTGHLGRTETQRGRLWTACGQRCVDSTNSQTTLATTSTSPNTPTTGRR